MREYLAAAQQVRDELFAQFDAPLWERVSLRDIRTVVLLAASSRGGSSLLFDLLKRTPQLLSLHGEHVPLYKINACSLPAQGCDSDQLSTTAGRPIERLSRDILSEVGVGGAVTAYNVATFSAILALRLVLQWPHLELSAEQWLSYLYDARQRLSQQGSENWHSTRLLLEVLYGLTRDGYRVNPYYYDISQATIQRYFPTLSRPAGPPNATLCIEEPPFITVQPRRLPTEEEIREKPLLLKASVDAYRLPFLKELFPKAHFKILHLTRNPAASINGLYDGWLDRGFFSHNLRGRASLSIAGYSELSDWGASWWNYDLPPQWEEMTSAPLEEVCAFQWSSAHRSILESTAQEEQDDVLRIKFEPFTLSMASRYQAMETITKFLDIQFDEALHNVLDEWPVVMATEVPRKRRWQVREKRIWPLVTQPRIVELVRELGYAFENEEDWV